jgi:hypothetical protein
MNADVRVALEQPGTAVSTQPATPLLARFVEPAEWQAMNDAAYTVAACGHFLKQLRDTAALYRAVALYRKTQRYLVGMKQDLGEEVLAAKAQGFDPFSTTLGRLLWASHPATWTLCKDCSGANPACLACRGAGFHMGADYPRFRR